MRPERSPLPENANPNVGGINSLPQYTASDIGLNPDDYAPLSGGQDYNPPPAIATPPAVPIPRATFVPQNDWRGNSGSYRTNYPVPGTPSTTSPLDPHQGFFARLFGSIGNLGQDAIGGVGGLFDRLRGQPAAQPAPAQPPPRPIPSLAAIYNSGRIPGAPAFSPTLAQNWFPGSLIGPTSGASSNPYSGTGPLGGRQPLGGPPSAAATAFSNTVKARNII